MTCRRVAALADVPLKSPAPRGGVRGIFHHRYLLHLLVKREVTARYTGSFLGWCGATSTRSRSS